MAPAAAGAERGSFAAALKSAAAPAAPAEPAAAPNFDRLPHDVVSQIIESLPGDCLPAAAAVCRLWRVAVAAAAGARLQRAGLGWLKGRQGLQQLQLYTAVYANFLRSPRAGGGPGTAWEETKGHEGVAQMAWECPARCLPPPPPPRAPPAPPLPPSALSRLPLLLRRQLWRLAAPQGAAAATPAVAAPAARRLAGALVCCGTTWGEARQVIDLLAELQSRGLSPADAARLLDSRPALRLSLCVSAWPGARPRPSRGGGGGDLGGCGGVPVGLQAADAAAGSVLWAPPSADFAFGLQLDDGRSERFSFETFVRTPSSFQFYSGRCRAEEGAGWAVCEHLVPAVPPGARRASVLLRARGAAAPGPAAAGGCGGGGGLGGGAGSSVAPAVRFASIELSFVPASEA